MVTRLIPNVIEDIENWKIEESLSLEMGNLYHQGGDYPGMT